MRPVAILLVIASAVSASFAQSADPFGRAKPAAKPAASRAKVSRKPVRKAGDAPKRETATEAPTLLVGDQSVKVTDATRLVTIHLGLAPGGVTMLEFPGDDPIYAVHPGDQALVTVDTTSKRASDPIILRPGAGFAAPESRRERWPSALVTVQMSSGLVVSCVCYPVRTLAQSTRRIAMVYDRSAVVAARRTGGLAVNLGMPAQPVAIPEAPATARSEAVPVAPATVRRPSDPRLVATVQYAGTRPRTSAAIDAARLAHEELERVIAAPKKMLSKFSGATHGLAIAATTTRDVDVAHRIVTIAIKNDSKADIRLVAGEPSIWIETLDGEDRPVQIVAIDRIRVETTSVERLVPAGGIVYTTIVYRTPTLGARQRLRVAVSHVDAADEPATTDLARPGDRN